MTHYLIEFRFSGKAKSYLKDLMYEVSHKFKVHGATRDRAIPHITLVGPLYTSNERRLVNDVVSVVHKYDYVNFKLDGFGHFHSKGFFNWLFGKQKVIFVEVKGSENLNNLRWELVQKLKEYCTLNEHDYEKDRHFHATIAFKDINARFDDIWEFIQRKQPPDIKQLLLRITIIKDQKILYEYDLFQKRLLNRWEARDNQVWRKTFQILNRKSETLK